MSAVIADNAWKLLPRNSTQLERDLLKVPRFDSHLHPEAATIATFKRGDNIPPTILPWLDVEYGLGRLGEFITDPRQRITEGIQFNREIGTPAAIMRAAGWVGMNGRPWEEPEPGLHFAEFQFELLGDIPADLSVLYQLSRALNIAKPARTRFRRVFNSGWDVKHFVLDKSDWGDLLSDYSGVDFDERTPGIDRTGLVVSLGRSAFLEIPEKLISADIPVEISTLRERDLFFYVGWVDWPILDDDYYRSFYPYYMRADFAEDLDDLWTGPVNEVNFEVTREQNWPVMDEDHYRNFYPAEGMATFGAVDTSEIWTGQTRESFMEVQPVQNNPILDDEHRASFYPNQWQVEGILAEREPTI